MQFDSAINAESAANIDALLRAVFPTEFEANLVNRLRIGQALAAEHGLWHQGALIGYVAYSPVSIEYSQEPRTIWGLGPMAIAPDMQQYGYGTKLLIDSVAAAKADALILLGHVDFYQQAGFIAAAEFGLQFGDDETRESAFMAKEKVAGALSKQSGRVTYHPAFYDE